MNALSCRPADTLVTPRSRRLHCFWSKRRVVGSLIWGNGVEFLYIRQLAEQVSLRLGRKSSRKNQGWEYEAVQRGQTATALVELYQFRPLREISNPDLRHPQSWKECDPEKRDHRYRVVPNHRPSKKSSQSLSDR